MFDMSVCYMFPIISTSKKTVKTISTRGRFDEFLQNQETGDWRLPNSNYYIVLGQPECMLFCIIDYYENLLVSFLDTITFYNFKNQRKRYVLE